MYSNNNPLTFSATNTWGLQRATTSTIVSRPPELGRAVGRLTRELRAVQPEAAERRLMEGAGFDERAARNLLAYLEDQAAATGAVPDDRTVVVQRFRDEVGDWRVCILTPYGGRVHAPWSLALQALLT